MTHKEVKKLYKLANEKFEGIFKYNNKKTKQDFIKIIRKHFTNSILSNKEILYENQNVNIDDLKLEWKVNIDTYPERAGIYSFSTLKAGAIIIASIFTSFLTSLKTINNYSYILMGQSMLIEIMIFWGIFMLISKCEESIKRSYLHEKFFYMICLKVLEEF